MKYLTAALLLVALAAKAEEPWEACHAEPLDDAVAIANWNAARTANNWSPNWPDAVPARSLTAVVAPASADADAKYLLSNKRWLVLFDEWGRIRGITDRRYGQEFVRDPVDPTAVVPWQAHILLGTKDTSQYGSITGWAPIQATTVTTFTDAEGGTGIQFSQTQQGLTHTQSWYLSLNPDRPGIFVTMTVSGTANGTWTGYGIVSGHLILHGLLLDGVQSWMGPHENIGALIPAFTAGDESVVGMSSVAPYPNTQMTARFGAVMNDTRHGLYVGIEDETAHVKFNHAPTSTTNTFRIQAFPQNSGGVGNSLTVGPVRLLPTCSEALPAALAKEYGRWSLTQPQFRGKAVVSRTDVLKDVQVISTMNVGGNAWSTIRDESGKNCRTQGGNVCTSGTVDDYLSEELVGVNLGWWSANWDTPQFDRGNPIKTTKAGVAAVNAGVIADYPDSLLLAYQTPVSVDISTLYNPAHVCGGVGPATSITDSHADIPALLAAVQRKAEYLDTCTDDDGALEEGCNFITTTLISGTCHAYTNPNEPAAVAYETVWYENTLAAGFNATYWDVIGVHQCDHTEGRSYPPGCHPNMFTGWQAYLHDRNGFGDQETREVASDYLNAEVYSHINWTQHDLHKNALLAYPVQELIYHDQVLGGGSRFDVGDSTGAMAEKVALATVWGDFIGPAVGIGGRADFTNGLADGLVEAAIKSAAAARTSLARFLVEGTMLAVMEPGSGRGTSDTEAIVEWCNVNCAAPGTESGTLYSIQGAWWRSPAGEIALIYRNADPSNASVAYVRHLPGLSRFVSQDCSYLEAKGACAASSSVNYNNDLFLNTTAGQTRIMYFDPDPT